jgi:hypothetical protein
MPRGKASYLVLPLVAVAVSLALSSCRVFDYEQREPWRAEAEEKCLAEKIVQPSAYMEPESQLDGRGTCGMVHPFKVAAMDGGMVEVTPKATLACPIIGAVDRWIAESVQPAAATWFGEQVVEIHQISAYSCRTMNGQPGTHISEHAFGNALDVAAFKLRSGREIVIKNAWKNGPYEERGFLHDIISDACERFTTVLGPGANVFHYDHFHLDLSRHASARTYCNPKVARMTPPNRAYARAPQQRAYPQTAARGPSAPARDSYPQQNYGNDLPLGERPPQYEPRQAARASYPQGYPQAGGEPMDLHGQPQQPSYASQPTQAAPNYAPAYAPQPQPSYPAPAPDPYRMLPPRNIGAKLESKNEIMTGSIGKKSEKKKSHTKPLAKKHETHRAPVAQKPAAKPRPAAKSMTSTDLFSPVPVASQNSAPRKEPIEEATMRALRAH